MTGTAFVRREDDKTAVVSTMLASKLCPPGPESDWIDRFMERILGRDYDSAREILRSAVARGIGKSIAEQYGKVLEEFLQRRYEIENPPVEIARFGACAVKEMENQTGRGLVVPCYQNWNDELWHQRPVAYIQSPSSRKAAQVCPACLVPIGTLASQLAYMGLPSQEGAELVEVADGAGPLVLCPGGCAQLYCSQACCNWAQEYSSHALLCPGRLSSTACAALEALDQLAVESDTEHLLLLAHHVAVALLQRKSGQELPNVMEKYVNQFFSRPWDTLADADDADGDTPASRRKRLLQAHEHLQHIFAGEDLAAPFLTIEVLSGMLGTYDLVNMTISIPHPLNVKGDRIADVMKNIVLAELHGLQKGVCEDSDEEDDESEGESSADEGDAGGVREATTEVAHRDQDLEALTRKGALFANIVGTSLIEALSYMNHSCLPNARIDFMTSVTPDVPGPGLWVYSAARRPLMPGDEVQMCYVPSVIGKPVEERQKRMKRFGFECKCRCCLTDEMLKAEGDIVINPIGRK
jgi:hypothetical protein